MLLGSILLGKKVCCYLKGSLCKPQFMSLPLPLMMPYYMYFSSLTKLKLIFLEEFRCQPELTREMRPQCHWERELARKKEESILFCEFVPMWSVWVDWHPWYTREWYLKKCGFGVEGFPKHQRWPKVLWHVLYFYLMCRLRSSVRFCYLYFTEERTTASKRYGMIPCLCNFRGMNHYRTPDCPRELRLT